MLNFSGSVESSPDMYQELALSFTYACGQASEMAMVAPFRQASGYRGVPCRQVMASWPSAYPGHRGESRGGIGLQVRQCGCGAPRGGMAIGRKRRGGRGCRG